MRNVSLLGGAANIAANLQSLGARVSFLSVVGQDMTGSLLRKALRLRHSEDQWVITDPIICTPHKLRILANDQPIARFDEGDGSNSQFSPEVQQRLIHHLEELYPLCNAIILSDYGYGILAQCIEHLQQLQRTFPRTMLENQPSSSGEKGGNKIYWRGSVLLRDHMTKRRPEAQR